MTGPSVLVVGAGLIGRSVAYYAARAGAAVDLVDADADPSAATRASLGVLTHFNGRDDAFSLLYRDGHALHALLAKQLDTETGADVGWRAPGGIDVAFDDADMQAVHELAAFNTERGCPAEILDGAAVRELEPRLRAEAVGGLYFAGDHRVEPPALAAALLAAAQRHGAQARFGLEVRHLEPHGAGVRVELADGDGPRQFDFAVVAAGAWSGELLAGVTPQPVAVRPVRGQHCVYRVGGDLPRHILRYDRHHLVPTAAGLVVGSTVEEVGFEVVTTAAAAGEFDQVLDRVLGIRATVEGHRAGLRPKPRKGRPVIAPLDDMPCVFVASGHYKSGVLLGPITGQTLAAWILDGEPPRDMSPFAIHR